MKLIVLVFLSLISLTSILAGGPFSEIPSLPCNNKLCAGQCLSNGQSLKSCDLTTTLEVTINGQINLFVKKNGELGGAFKPIYANKNNCPEVKICLDSTRFVISACDKEVFVISSDTKNGCIQANDDGAIYFVNESGEITSDVVSDVGLIDY